MVRGFVSGALWGILVVAVGFVISVAVQGSGGATSPSMSPEEAVTEPVENATPEDVPAEDAEAETSTQPSALTDETPPEVAPTPQTPPAPPGIVLPTPETQSSLPQTDTESTGRPVAETTDVDISAPQTVTTTAGVTVQIEAPVLPGPQAAPGAPEADVQADVVTEPAQVNDQAEASVDLSSEVPFAEETAPTVVEASPVQTTPEAEATPPTVADASPAQPAPNAEETAPSVADISPAQPSSDTGVSPPVVFQVPPTRPVPDTGENAPEVQDEVVAALPRVRQQNQGTPIGDLAPNITTNRLPNVGNQGTEAVEDDEPLDFGLTGQALVDYAEPFDNPDAKPLMAIVLLDDGETELGPEALQTFPFPITFAVDASRDGAGDRMRLFREAGFEVVMTTDLPSGATPGDVETAYEVYKSNVPEAVAVLEDGTGGFQSNASMIGQVVDNLGASGHGLLLYSGGLNTGLRVAQREGLPAKLVFRDFDADGQDERTIRRFLDRAAFRAEQEEGVIMVGRMRPDTISALLVWGLQDRASTVALAPVSALLTAP